MEDDKYLPSGNPFISLPLKYITFLIVFMHVDKKEVIFLKVDNLYKKNSL